MVAFDGIGTAISVFFDGDDEFITIALDDDSLNFDLGIQELSVLQAQALIRDLTDAVAIKKFWGLGGGI